MNKTWIILRHEITSLTNRFSFWFSALGIPLIGFLLFAGISVVNRSQGAETPSPFQGIGQVFTPPEETRPQGYVDEAGLITAFPDHYDSQSLIRYASTAEAQQALDAETIGAYYVIPPDYVQTGDLPVYTLQYDLMNSETRSDAITNLINYNLLNGDTQLLNVVRQPIQNLHSVSVAPAEAGPVRNPDSMWTFFLPYGVMMLFYVSIMGSSGLLLNSVAKEKENRIMEVLLMSTSPHQLLLGKIIGLGIVGLFQVLIWAASALTLLRLSGQTFDLPPATQLPPSILLWGIIFFLLGYLVYATLMAGVGALVPNLREASQATTLIILPLIVPLVLISALIQSPNSPLAVGLSLFPLTAPTTMMLRLAAANVPTWQPLLAIVLLVFTALLIIRAVAGMFRAQTILSGQSFKTKRFFQALIGKA